MKNARAICLAAACAAAPWPALGPEQGPSSVPEAFDHAHAPWTRVLARHVVGDRVDYAALKEDHADLDRYLERLHAVGAEELAAWSREDRFAFWINAYNAHCVSLVVSEYPVDSIEDIGGLFSPVWKKAFIDMPALHPSGKPRKLSLDDVEHGILRPRFADARVHAAVNCASASCPALRPEAYVGERLDEQLDEQVRRWLADPSRNRFDAARKRLELSRIFDWFAEDFVRDGGSVVGWIAQHAPEPERSWILEPGVAVKYLDYSWRLNDAKR